MGSFIGHILSGTLFLLVGLWHIWSSVVRSASSPKTFRVRIWNPVPGFHGRLKHLELYFISIGVFISLCVELLIGTQLKIFDGGILNATYLNNFEHSGTMLFFLSSVLLPCYQKIQDMLPCQKVLYVSFFPQFSTEYILFYYHSTTHTGLEGYYHILLGFLVRLCIISTIAGALLPTSFSVDLCSSIAITLQGIWLYQTAFVFYGPMLPSGCTMRDNIVTCHSNESEVHGELLANFQLFFAVLVVLVGTIASYGFAASRYGNFEEVAPN